MVIVSGETGSCVIKFNYRYNEFSGVCGEMNASLKKKIIIIIINNIYEFPL